MDNGGYVYLLGDSSNDGAFKIGVTRGSVERRIKKLQTGNSNEIYLECAFKTKYPFLMEKMLHARHLVNKKRDEWFYLNKEEVSNFLNECKLVDKEIEDLKDNPFFRKKCK